jgi:hypothetical protein
MQTAAQAAAGKPQDDAARRGPLRASGGVAHDAPPLERGAIAGDDGLGEPDPLIALPLKSSSPVLEDRAPAKERVAERALTVPGVRGEQRGDRG